MSRIETREAAVFFIYQTDFRSEDLEDQIRIYIESNPSVEDDKDYFFSTVMGVMDNRESIDAKITSFLKKWTINRIPKLDRAILETAVYEIENVDDIPVSVTINEAVELCKKYGGEDDFAFVNGILGSYVKTLEHKDKGVEK